MKKKFLTLGLVTGISAAVLWAAPAYAYPEISSLSVSPTTIRGGDEILVTINGQTSGQFIFSGCVVAFFNGLPLIASDYDPLDPQIYVAGSIVDSDMNRYGDAVQYKVEGFIGACSSLTPSDTPAWSTNEITLLPQLVIDPVTLTVGASGPVTVDYTTAAPGGVSPFDWTSGYGGDFRELDPSSCSLLIPFSIGDSELPPGVTISDTQSPSGSAPELVLNGAPEAGSAGTYNVCVGIADDTGENSAAWMTVTVVAATLPSTGFDAATALASAGVAGLASLAGIALVLVRRRRVA